MSEKITEKLRKLLALSHSTNEHEAAQALAQAIRLAAKHGVDIEKLKGTEFSGSISEEDAMVKAGFKAWERQLFLGVARLFGCSMLTGYKYNSKRGRCDRRLVVCGAEQDRPVVICLATYLHRQVQKLYNKNKRDVRLRVMLNHLYGRMPSEYKIQQDYLYGAVVTVLQNAEKIFKTEAPEEYQEQCALVLKKEYAVQNYLKEKAVGEARKSTFDFSSGAEQYGAKDAQDISIHKSIAAGKPAVKGYVE